jgi:hypothetical protein
MMLMEIRKSPSGTKSGIGARLAEAPVDRLGKPDLGSAGVSKNIAECPV